MMDCIDGSELDLLLQLSVHSSGLPFLSLFFLAGL